MSVRPSAGGGVTGIVTENHLARLRRLRCSAEALLRLGARSVNDGQIAGPLVEVKNTAIGIA